MNNWRNIWKIVDKSYGFTQQYGIYDLNTNRSVNFTMYSTEGNAKIAAALMFKALMRKIDKELLG